MLILKNELKDEFKRVGLDEITVSRDNNGYLWLAGSCGKKIVRITDFSVSSKLTKTERKIATENYILPTIAKYASDIKDMIDSKEEADKTYEIIEAEKKKLNVDDYSFNVSNTGSGYCRGSEPTKRDFKVSGKIITDDYFLCIGMYSNEKHNNDKKNAEIHGVDEKVIKANMKLFGPLRIKAQTLYDLAEDYYQKLYELELAQEKLKDECGL